MLKRLFDLVLSGSALFFLAIPMVFLALLIRLKLGSPVFFTQVRPGRDGKLFKLVKFRTMLDTRDAEGNLLPDEERISEFGLMLRRTSLDELPELWNILKGDMSFVGPRPLLTQYLPLYSKEQARRHDVSPGLTGLAQINGRNDLSWDDRFAMDVWYVDKPFLLAGSQDPDADFHQSVSRRWRQQGRATRSAQADSSRDRMPIHLRERSNHRRQLAFSPDNLMCARRSSPKDVAVSARARTQCRRRPIETRIEVPDALFRRRPSEGNRRCA